MTDPAGTTSYTYDGRNRLTDASGPGLTRTYGYDPNFNRTSKTENGTTTSYGSKTPMGTPGRAGTMPPGC